MVTRTPVYKLLLGSAVVSILFVIVVVRLLFGGSAYQPGETVEYHPPATEEMSRAEAVIDELGGDAASNDTVEPLFTPEFEEGKAVATETRLSHRAVSAGTEVTVHGALAVRARPLSELVGEKTADDARRTGLNIALVIDRSGSMFGMKLDNAKAASRALIDYLGPKDRLAIVTYGTDVTTLTESLLVTATNRGRLHAAVASIECYGGTNLSGGLLRGRELVEAAEGGDRINRLLLLSDGQANEGIISEYELAKIASNTLEQGTSVTTMGVGLDYNEDLLQQMARSGAGNYYFIEDASSTEEVFAAELHGLKSTVARSVELKLSTPTKGEIVGVSGVEFRRRGRDVVIDLDTLSGGEQKDLLVEVRFEPGDAGRQVVLDTRLVYTDVASGEGVVQTGTVDVDVTTDTVETDPLVIRRLLHIRTASAFDEAMALYDRGDRFAAADLLDRRRKENRNFVESNELDDPQVANIDTAFGRLSESLRKTERHSTKGKWISKSTKYKSANVSVSSEVTF